MLFHALDSEEVNFRELKDRRKSLWKQFENHPNEIHLAAILKNLDDQIARRNPRIDQDADKIDDSEIAAVPEVEGLFLLLALSQRRGS
jgi:hypothetical protein